MIAPAQHTRVHLALGSTDMRKGINGLSILVEAVLELDPFSGICSFSATEDERP
jgi:transposase